MIGMGAETVVDYALRFKARVRPRHLGVRLRGRHDRLHPLAPRLGRRGYEGGSNLYEYGRPALRWAGDIEDRIAAAVHKLVKQVGE